MPLQCQSSPVSAQRIELPNFVQSAAIARVIEHWLRHVCLNLCTGNRKNAESGAGAESRTMPGQIALTRILNLPSSLAVVCARLHMKRSLQHQL